MLAALKAGARGYILKGVLGSELIKVIQTVHSGGSLSYVTLTLAASLLVDMMGKSEEKRDDNPLDELTKRETQISELVAQGQRNKEIGEQLYLAEKTVKHHMTNILQKLHVRNRVEATLLAQNMRSDKEKS